MKPLEDIGMAGGLLAKAKVGATRILPKLAVYAPLKQVSPSSSLKQNQASLRQTLQNLQAKSSGASCNTPLFSGVEASLDHLGADGVEQKETCQMIQEHGLEVLINLDIPNESNQQSNTDLVRSFESQLITIANFGIPIAHINCKSIGNSWHEQSALDYLLEILPLSAEFLEAHPHIGKDGNETDIMGGAPNHLTGISHQTRGMLRHPRVVREVLEIIPPLRLTMDLSRWHQECGYAWGSSDKDGGNENEEEVLSIEIVPHIDLIRTKTLLLSQIYKNALDGGLVDNDPYLRTNQFLWEAVWARKGKRGVKQLYIALDDATNEIGQYNSSENEEYLSRIDRLADAATTIHQYYDDWSTSILEAKS